MHYLKAGQRGPPPAFSQPTFSGSSAWSKSLAGCLIFTYFFCIKWFWSNRKEACRNLRGKEVITVE